jgi:chromosome segregation ATPase
VSFNLISGRRQAKHRGKSGLELRRELAAAEGKIASLTAAVDQISAERTTAEGRADRTAIDLDAARKEIARLENVVQVRDQRIADLERRVEVGVRAEHVVAETQPIPVTTPVLPLHKSPLDNSGHIPAWAGRSETATQ